MSVIVNPDFLIFVMIVGFTEEWICEIIHAQLITIAIVIKETN